MRTAGDQQQERVKGKVIQHLAGLFINLVQIDM